MTTNETADDKPLDPPPRPRFSRACRCCSVVSAIVVLHIAIVLILFFTLFKPKDPTTTLLSAAVSGVSPRVSLPVVRLELNVSLDLLLLVHNPNRASFRHHPGKSFVFYRGTQVGEVDISAGRIPARGSERIPCKLTIQADRFVSEVAGFVEDILAGEVGFNTTSRIPGRIIILGIFKRHAVASAECYIAVGFPDLKIKRQECRHQTKL